MVYIAQNLSVIQILSKSRECDQKILSYVFRKLHGSSYNLALESIKFLRKLIASGKYSSYEELLSLLKTEGHELTRVDPTEFVVGNMVLRVLKLVREDQCRLEMGTEETFADGHDSLHNLWKTPESSRKAIGARQLRKGSIEVVNELLVELETVHENIASQALDHILDQDVIFTIGHSLSALVFLEVEESEPNDLQSLYLYLPISNAFPPQHAASKRRFRVIVAENSPSNDGVVVVERLAHKIDDIRLVADTDVMSCMAQTTRVILGARALMADGAFVGPAGSFALCLAAKRHSVPVIVCAAFYKLTPKFLSSNDEEDFSRMLSPCDLVPFSEANLFESASIVHPSMDLIPPEFVTLYIPQTFAIVPSHIYRLLGEYFHLDDIN